MRKQRPSSCTHLLSPLQSPNLLLSTTISVCGYEISFSSSAKNLGFYIRDDMSVELHIKNICQVAYPELHRISTIWHLLSVDSTKTLVSAFVLSRLDYCNSLLSGCLKHLFENNKRSRTQLQDSSSQLINEIMFHSSSELFTSCSSKHVSSLSCQHSTSPFSLLQPLFICLTFSVSTLHQDSSAPPLTQELYAFCT